MTNSIQKGKRGERAWRDKLREAGFLKSYRGQQFQGGTDSPDVVCPELPGIHFEVKYTQRLDLYGAVLQAITDTKGSDKIPVVAHRKNNAEWLVIMRADEWFSIVKEAGLAKAVFCPDCQTSDVRKRRSYLKGGYQYECLNIDCAKESFLDA
jgi:Holliday junction resolvase